MDVTYLPHGYWPISHSPAVHKPSLKEQEKSVYHFFVTITIVKTPQVYKIDDIEFYLERS